MKAIIQRNLPLNTRYTVIDKKYVPVLEGGGCTCDNCGQLIANIATVRNEHGIYNVGFDCLETFLMNNNLLDGFNPEELEKVKRWIGQIIRFSKSTKETILKSKEQRGLEVTGLLFERPTHISDWFTYYWLQNGQETSRDNDSVKIKGMDFDFLITTLRNIFPKLNILIKELEPRKT